jgi:hypothetical protein
MAYLDQSFVCLDIPTTVPASATALAASVALTTNFESDEEEAQYQSRPLKGNWLDLISSFLPYLSSSALFVSFSYSM